MVNIKQKIQKFILSFLCLTFVGSCDITGSNPNSSKADSASIANVAILLPLSGNESEINKEYVQMIKLGLAESAKSKIKIASYDIANNEKLEESINKIIDSGVDIVIGPIYSEDTKLVANKLDGKNITIISMSNNPAIAEKELFVLGHAPMRQLEQLAGYFLGKNYKNYVALLPNNRMSNLTSKILNDMISNGGGKLEKIEFYGNEDDDISKSVKAISDSVDAINESDVNLTKPVVFLSSEDKTMQILQEKIIANNLDKKAKLSGDSRIDINAKQDIDVIFTSSNNMINSDIAKAAKTHGINHISFMHAIAYDAGKIVGESIGNHYNKKAFLDRMSSPEKFFGISGDINFIDSIAQRHYDIIQKSKGQYKSISDSQ